MEDLDPGEGWSHTTWSSDGTSWTPTSSTPPLGRDGDSGERLFVETRADVAGEEGRFRCEAWLQAGPRTGLRATGTIAVHVLVDGAPARSRTHTVQTQLGPGQRSGVLPWEGDVVVDAPSAQVVSCRVSYQP